MDRASCSRQAGQRGRSDEACARRMSGHMHARRSPRDGARRRSPSHRPRSGARPPRCTGHPRRHPPLVRSPTLVRGLRNSSGHWSLPRTWTGLCKTLRLSAGSERQLGAGYQCHRRLITDCAMRSHLVVVDAPAFHLRPSVVQIQKPVLVEALGSEPRIERLGTSVVGLASQAC